MQGLQCMLTKTYSKTNHRINKPPLRSNFVPLLAVLCSLFAQT